jgi:hypothetical protein
VGIVGLELLAVAADAGVSGKWPSYARPHEQKLTHAGRLTRSATALSVGGASRGARVRRVGCVPNGTPSFYFCYYPG